MRKPAQIVLNVIMDDAKTDEELQEIVRTASAALGARAGVERLGGNVAWLAEPGEDRDKFENELLAAGAMLGALMVAQAQGSAVMSVSPVSDARGQATTSLDVTFSFLKSPYRISVAMAPEEPF